MVRDRLMAVATDAEPAPERPAEVVRFEAAFGEIATGADDLAFRLAGYHLLMGASLQLPRTRHFDAWPDVVAATEALDATALPLAPRTARYIAGVLRAFHTFARVRAGAGLTYLEQVAAYLELRDVWVPESELEALRTHLLRLLADAGYPDDLARGIRAWERARAVPVDRIVAHCAPLVETAKRATRARGIPVPERVAVDVAVLSSPYYAYAHYHGGYRGTVALTTDLLWTEEGLKHSVCHEAFPGHHASASVREWAIANGTWSDVHLPSLANTPVSPIVEGVAENGLEMLGWQTTLDDELFSAHNRLLFAARTNAAILRHEHKEPRRQVIAYLMRETGASEDWAVYQERFISDPLWHTSFPHYWHGARLIREARRQFQGRERDLYAELYGHPQTTSTLRDLLAADAARPAAGEPTPLAADRGRPS
jgi:hypothetical protein